ncbi:neutral zinc metallopeptidase [Streptosporangium sp. NPDC023615]|uniref:neutral zinc metallopeptidase n=1 Tax=Streptosporangium sp. NPDC023615 TaxID=3154794 RepID=UPI0034402A92
MGGSGDREAYRPRPGGTAGPAPAGEGRYPDRHPYPNPYPDRHARPVRRTVRRTLPVLLAFAVVLGGLAYFGDDLRELLGTAPGSPRSRAATHGLHERAEPIDARCAGLPKDLDADAEASLTAFGRCLDRMWTSTLDRAGTEYAPPEQVRLVTSPSRAACGTGEHDWAGIYCSDSRVVNVLVEDGAVFPMMFTLAHEYAHHVQEVTGLADRRGSETFDEAWSRRLELQADCLAAATLRTVAPRRLERLRALAGSRDADADDDVRADHRRSHGSGASGAEWMRRGQEEGSVAACNTWGAPAGQVS